MAEKTVNGEKASIIVVSYNALAETTAPCLWSIFEMTDHPDFEVIVVDNNSTDGTRDYLRDLAAREPRLKCIFNTANRGFAGGNNDAIRVANGQYLVLLNSDTQVSHGWLSRLISVLREDLAVGLVGPVSNATGNEQTIATSGKAPDEILAEGAEWSNMCDGNILPMERLCFFCVAMRREIIERVGLLDEMYGRGFYEDDDYCLRVRNAGFRLVCCEDVFLYHRGSASFKAIPAETRRLLKTNLKLLQEKFSISYRPRHPRERILNILEDYLSHLDASSATRITFKIDNRLRQLETMRPRSIFKKMIFLLKLMNMKKKIARELKPFAIAVANP